VTKDSGRNSGKAPVRSRRPRDAAAGFPSKEQIRDFIAESPVAVGKREIARAFGIKGGDRITLKAILKELKDEGVFEPRGRGKLTPPGQLPPVAVIEVSDIDEDGELIARPATWDEEGPPPIVYLAPERRSRSAYALGDRILARLSRIDDCHYEGRAIRRIAKVPQRILGIYERGPGGAGRLRPTDRRAKSELVIRPEHAGAAESGELILAELLPGRPHLGLKGARVVERLGSAGDPKALSLIAIHEHELPVDFSPDGKAEAEAAEPAPLGSRSDLRRVPLVTIDGADARDFDDAVWAEADPDPKNRGGWHLLIAIADVAWYVRPGSALDRDAFARGNSTYFPDRVVPMLPEALSNGWCSLRPEEDRPCLAAELWIDSAGNTRRHRFLRGMMRSHARLTYEQVQAARDGAAKDIATPLVENVIAPLYGAFDALLVARETRGTLDLDLPERRVVLDENGAVTAIEPRGRLESHRLIEEFMIAANVAAAVQLETLRRPCMYRVHDQPDPVKIEALRQILDSLDLRLARGQVIRPRALTDLLHKVADRPSARMVNELILRAQSQAVYSPNNIGHYGLALTRYAHFTSPIRRYADLLVHRSLIAGLGLGDGALPADAAGRYPEIGEHISFTERRSATAERDAVDRFVAAFLQERVGDIFAGAITSVTRFGLFVKLDETGADGLVPMSLLPDDYYVHDEASHSLVGRRWGRSYHLGERVMARLREAEPITGGLVLELVESEDADKPLSAATAGREAPQAGWHPLGARRDSKPATGRPRPPARGGRKAGGKRRRKPHGR